ncbi:amino acid ABC transporter substrate-binding protein (PAAT family) [Plasticicumulans lactativorans]|uniref:Amino acid ABC transporter substrate-binding protein (PAAT family) n=1 Tax=Plasticicumulans lactativorans TaxID=1133106 RepID=A0A4R2L7K0_9GAMM|nr:transporter substrate-binding domain-containing protein [Plasticicumulans lactativorans]TCO82616.1 amino acid ABC transporter substrate-binding protein (PAAT family) [Plasticicumulans lactativorans]
MSLKTFVNRARRSLLALGLGAVIAGALAGPAAAAGIDDIVSKKKLQVGVLVDVPPFGMTNANNEPEGYDVDVARLMAKYLGVELELVPVTGPNRIPFLLTNKVDVLIATFGITPERAKQVQFAIPYSSFDVVLLAPKAKAIGAAKDLKGVKVGVARASTQDTAVTAMAPQGTQIMRFDDDATTMQALLSGQIDAIGVTTLIARQIQEMNPAAEYEAKFVLRRQPNGIAMRRGDADLLQWVNTFIYFIKNNGELDAIHQKWLGKPLGELPVF